VWWPDYMLASWRRVRQFARALTARVHSSELAQVATLLPQPAVQLFAEMPRSVQRHSLDVLYCLQERGETDQELLSAALLHDVAKAEGIGIWHRVLFVLLRALGSGRVERVASSRPGSWRSAIWAQLHHAQRGAELAEAAGCAPATVLLIRFHQPDGAAGSRPPPDRRLRALQAADEQA